MAVIEMRSRTTAICYHSWNTLFFCSLTMCTLHTNSGTERRTIADILQTANQFHSVGLCLCANNLTKQNSSILFMHTISSWECLRSLIRSSSTLALLLYGTKQRAEFKPYTHQKSTKSTVLRLYTLHHGIKQQVAFQLLMHFAFFLARDQLKRVSYWFHCSFWYLF